ncbi:hypothetical protein COLO4_24733 [Corchorus olitorius]|uniref:Uncharacterized protein n=1 Tax=Corchorus olitorius TaxID=93759 RepID=A0A1R3I7E4_9ROSI|nr:hypothetical protein COLO4_24733 [Corchorus olitorius]
MRSSTQEVQEAMDSIKNMTRQRARSRPTDQENEESEAMSSTSQPRCSPDASKKSQGLLSYPVVAERFSVEFPDLFGLKVQWFNQKRYFILLTIFNQDRVKGLDHILTASSANSATNKV